MYIHSMKKIGLLLLICFQLTSSYAQSPQLSNRASIHIVTVGPYQAELYSAFGHSGIRVVDPVLGIDEFYNYGVFNFNQPNFYLNFARGYLNYQLAVMDYPRVRSYYQYQNRYIHEQVLNLNSADKQKLFDFLQWNAQPENMYYYYDYFYDNCATRVRDALEKTFEDRVVFEGDYIDTDYTIRDLTDIYLQEQPWGDLGIDICLGLPMDKKATPYMYMFLPDYIESGFNHAKIKVNGNWEPLVSRTIEVYKAVPMPSAASTITPMLLFSIVALLVLFVTWKGYKANVHKPWIDSILFSVVGLVGWLLFLLWVATDHKAAAVNFNLLWAIPLYFPLGLLLLKNKSPKWIHQFFGIAAIIGTLTLISWPFLPQDLHNSIFPITVLLVVRAGYIYYRKSST